MLYTDARLSMAVIVTGQVAVATDTAALDVSAINSVLVGTSGGNVTIGGLANERKGQMVHIVKSTSANTLTLSHNAAAGTQKIITPHGLDITLSTFGGATLVCNGANWLVSAQ